MGNTIIKASKEIMFDVSIVYFTPCTSRRELRLWLQGCPYFVMYNDRIYRIPFKVFDDNAQERILKEWFTPKHKYQKTFDEILELGLNADYLYKYIYGDLEW